MIPVTGYEGKAVAVLGLGCSGLAAARALVAGDATPVCWDDNPEARAKAEQEGLEIRDLTLAGSWHDVVKLVVSPGIAHLYPEPHPVIVRAWGAGALVDNDIGLFFEAIEGSEARAIAITGSNGKSTTTALVGHVLKRAGLAVEVGGNIGTGVLDLAPPQEDTVYVLELSSYQTDLARRLMPDVAIFLNLSPDHLDRHGGLGGYFAAKRRLFDLTPPGRAIIGVDEPEGRFLANALRGDKETGDPVTAISVQRLLKGTGHSVFAANAMLSEWHAGAEKVRLDLSKAPSLAGAHNWQNACAAYAACRRMGLEPEAIEAGFASFLGLEHRLERIGKRNGVLFVNDSKATNADAAEKALQAYDQVRWIVGGLAKEGGIGSLKDLFAKIVKAYLIGTAAADFAWELGSTPWEITGTLDGAVEAAAAEAKPGEVVLLSPACASFDQYPSFDVRGDAYRRAVAALDGITMFER